MKESINIGEKLKELRLAHNYKQADIAAAADIRQQTYSAYESGKTIPSPLPLYKIASFYGISTDDLLKLCLDLDDNIYFDALPASDRGIDKADFLKFSKDEKYVNLDPAQKELLYHFSKLDTASQKDVTDYAAFKHTQSR